MADMAGPHTEQWTTVYAPRPLNDLFHNLKKKTNAKHFINL